MQIPVALLFHNRFDNNFRHFILETLFLLQNIRSVIDKYPEIKFIIGEDFPKHNFEALQIMNLTDRIIRVQDKQLILCEKLIVHGSNVNTNTSTYDKFIKQFTKKCCQMTQLDISSNKFRNIYLSRENYDKFPTDPKQTPKRWVTNFNKITPILSNNFTKIVCDELYLWDQIALINRADTVILLIGAGCDNIHFAGKQTKFCVLYPDFCSPWINCYRFSSNLKAWQVGQRDTLVNYNPSWGANDSLNGPWKIDSKQVHKLVKSLRI